MAAVSNDQLLEHFRDRISNTSSEQGYVFNVTQIQRHLLDPAFQAETGVDPGQQAEAYDVTISDRLHKTKCLLHPGCNQLVQTGQLTAGSLIAVNSKHCQLYCNDLDLAADSIIILDQVAVCGSYDGDDLDPDCCEFCGSKEKEDRPLIGGRGSYHPLWNLEDPVGLQWKTNDPSNDVTLPASRITIAELSSRWKRISRPYPALVVRVINRARLRMYGKQHKRDKWPYQLYLEVADSSGTCNVTVWGGLCTDLLYSIQEGSVLILKSYSARDRYQLMSRPTLRHRDLTPHSLEVGLDQRNPAAEVTVVDPGAVSSEWGLPAMVGCFYTRAQISSLPDKYNFDIIGIVLSVGRYHRIRRPDSQDFWLYRWIHLIDQTNQQPIIVELFSTSQPKVHRAIIPGKVAVITQVRLVHDVTDVTHSRQRRTLYVTTNNESQVHLVYADTPGPYSTHNSVREALRWRVTNDCQQRLLNGTAIGGCCKLPPLPQSLADYKAGFSEAKPLELTSALSLKPKLDSLYYLETSRINLQCYLLHVQYVTTEVTPKPRPAVQEVNLPDVVSPLAVKLRSGRVVKQNQELASPSKKRPHSPNKNTLPQKRLLSRTESVVDDKFEDLTTQNALGNTNPHPTWLPRVFKFTNGEAMMQKHLLLPDEKIGSRKKNVPELSDLDTRNLQDYLTLTLSGLNHQVALITHFLLPQSIPQGTSLVDLLAGKFDGTILTSQSKEERSQSIQDILTSAKMLKNVRLLIVLDAYGVGKEQELTVNRAYALNR